MAGFSKVYTSQSDYLKDVAKSTGLYSETEYTRQVENAQGDNYLAYLASLKDNLSTKFNKAEYDKLPEELKFGYLVHTNDTDISSDNYKQNEEFYKQTIQKIKNDEIYESLNWFEKTMNTVGGWFANTAVAAYGTLEGLLNIGGATVGAVGALVGQEEFAEDMKKWVAKDVTGVTAATNAIANWRQAYTFENKLEWLKVANDVASAVGQMAPMIIGTALAPVTGGASAVGTAAYYLAMAGNTSEQAIRTNPDIDYVRLMGYTAGTTLLEWGTEWLSGKVFGEGLIGAKGLNPKAMTGSMIKSLTHNMATEAVEEAVSEIFGSLLEYWLVTDKDPDSLPTIENILYASLIGGLTGGFMAGGRIALTPRMAVTQQGEVKRVKDLTKEERQTVNKLGLRKSWALQGLLQESANALSEVDNLTKLQAKYGTLSLQQIQEQHADEYNKAIEKDVKIKEKQAESFLALSKLMSTIGVEKFTQSAQLLNDAVESARQMADNYINHTDVANKKASEVFAANFPDKSFTPAATPSKANQTLAETLRQAFPHLKVVFGTFGAKDGAPVRAINGAETYLFIDENMVAQKGYKQVLHEAVRYQLADQLMSDMNILDKAEVDALVKLFTDSDLSYDALDEKQKLTIAQMLCFDPVNSRRLFNHSMKTHKKIFKYITDQSEYVNKFGRQTEANKIRYHDLLVIRNMYLQNIAETLGNMEDIAVIQSEYGLSNEETQEKITDKTVTTNANDTIKLTEISQVKNAIHQREAFNELYNSRQDTTTDFDFDRLYDETYYSDEFVAKVTQTEPDFARALNQYVLQQHQTVFIDKATYTSTMESKLGMEDVNTLANILLTNEYLETKPSWIEKRAQVIDKLYLLQNMGIKTPEINGDTVIVKDDQIQGTGKLGFINIQLFAKQPDTDTLERKVPAHIQKQFAKSKVRGDSGQLLPVYHGTAVKFTDFDITKQSYDSNMSYGPGFNFMDDFEYAQNIRHDVIRVIDAYLNITHPASLTDVTIKTQNILKFVKEHFTKNQANILTDISKQTSDIGIITTLTSYAKSAEIFDNNFMEDIANTLGVDGVIAPQPNGNTLYLVYRNQDIYQVDSEGSSPSQVVEKRKSLNNVANKILAQFEDVSKSISETQFSESSSKEYSQVSYDMIDVMSDTFALVNNDNYDDIRDSLKKSNKKYAPQALEIFDLYTIEMVGKFNKDVRQKIENIYQKLQTEAGQRLALQSKRVATRKPISHTMATLARDGFNTTLTDEIVQKYDAKLKDKDAYIKELERKINELESQLKKTSSEIEKTALSKELKDIADKKGVIESGSNADIMDYIVTHAATLEQASKIQEDVLDRLLSTAVVAQEENKKVGYYVYDQDGKLKPFPKASEKIAKTLKKLKSFRMWAMLSSPVTWVRNWMGNQGMKGLDAMTNFVEGFMTSKTGFDKTQMKFTESRAGNELYKHIANQNQSYIMSLIRGEDVKYETSAEKAAELKRKERKIEYESANAFKKACLKAQDMTDWGLSTGLLGDEPVVFNSICKNMGNLVANNIDFLLQGIRQEAATLSKREMLNDKSQDRLNVLNKALQTRDAKDVFNALSKEETERLFDCCKERSFQQYFKNPNALSKWFAKFGTKHPVYAELISWVMPFPKVASNVLAMAYRYSPLSFFKGLTELSKYKQMQKSDYKGPITGFEKAQMIRTFSEASVGTFMLIAGAIFSAMGLIDIDEDDYMGPCIKIGDFKISLSDLAPSMTTFSTASAVVWAWKNDKNAITQALNVLYDNTLLGNVENLLTYGSFTDIGKNVSISYLSQYIPSILKLINKATTGGVKKDKSGTYLQRVIKTLGSYIPGISQLVPNKIDPYTGGLVYQAGIDNWFLNLLATISPLSIKWTHQSEFQRQASALNVETTGLSGKFKINDKDYVVEDKETYAKYRANYLENTFNDMLSGKQKVTVEDENGKRVTTTYDKLTDVQKKNVINRLYTEATTMTKIQWWVDQGNQYVVTTLDQYREYRNTFNSNNIVFKNSWSKSKFVEK